MPSYEYQCQECGKSFTIEQTIQEHSQKRLPKCPDCKKSRSVKRRLSPAYVLTSKKS